MHNLLRIQIYLLVFSLGCSHTSEKSTSLDAEPKIEERAPSAVQNIEILRSKFGTNLPLLTAEQLKDHHTKMDAFTKVAEDCVLNYLKIHRDFHAKYGVSNFIGVNTSIPRGKSRVQLKSVWKEGDTASALRTIILEAYKNWEPKNRSLKKQKQISEEDAKLIENMSCIGMTIRCLKQAFEETNQTIQDPKAPEGQKTPYEKFITYYRKPGKAGILAYSGRPMMLALKYGFGWKIAYWNPDPTAKRMEWMDTTPGDPPFRKHRERYKEVLDSNSYYEIPVDIMLVGPGAWGTDFEDTPALIKNTPFGVFGSTDFYHVGPFHNGLITEAHAGMMWYPQDESKDHQIKSTRVIESNPFSPLADGGAPRGHYPTGIIAIPPNYAP